MEPKISLKEILVLQYFFSALTASSCIVDTLYPDETDCTRFYECAPYGLQLFSCPLGLHFNPLANYCDWPDVAGCVVLTSQESILASTEQELFSELSQSDYEDVTTVLSVTEFTDEEQTVNDTMNQLLDGTTDKNSSAGPLEYDTTLEDFDEGQNKSTYSNSHSIDQTIVPRTDTASTNEIFTDDSITVYETQKTSTFSSSFATNVKDYSGASETHNLITSESSKIPEPDRISTNGLTSNNIANNQLEDINLEIINSKLDSTLHVLKSTSEVTTNIFLPEMASGSYLTTATNSEIEPAINDNYVTQENLREIIISSESSVIEDILSVDISSHTFHTDVPLTNAVVPEVQTQPSSLVLSVSNSHDVISRKTTINILESSTAEEKNDNALSTTQTFVTSDKLTATDKLTESVYTTEANFEVTTKRHVFFTSKSSTLYETTIIDTPSIISDEGKEIGIASITESDGNYIEISNSETQNLVTREKFSVLTDESTIENYLKPSTTEYFSSTQNNITSFNTSNEEPLILTQSTMSEKIEDQENYAVNQHGNSFSTDQAITITKEPLTVNDKFTVSIEGNLLDTEASTAKSSVSDEEKSDGIPSTSQNDIKTTENTQFSSQYGFAFPNIQDVVTNMSQILTDELIHSTTDNFPTTSNAINFTSQTNFEIIHSNKTAVAELEDPQVISFSEKESSFITQPYSTKTPEKDTISTKLTPSVTNGDLLIDQSMEYTSSALYASTLDVFASEAVTDVNVEQPSNNIVSVQYTSQIKSDEFSMSTANLITEQILVTTQETTEENSTEEALGDENSLWLQVNTTPEIEVFTVSEKPLILIDTTPKVSQDVIVTKINETLLEEIPSTSHTRVTSTLSDEPTTSTSFTDSTLESYLDNDPGTIGLNISNSEILYKPSEFPSSVSPEIENVATYTIHNMLITQLKENVTNISSDSESEHPIIPDFSSTQNKFLIDKSTPREIPTQDDNTPVTESVGVLNTDVLDERINNVLTVTPSNLIENTSRVTVIEEIFTDELHIIETTISTIEEDTVTENILPQNITNSIQVDFHTTINELQNESSQSSTEKATGYPSGGITETTDMNTDSETIAHQELTKATPISTNFTHFIIENVDKIQNIVQDAVDVGLETINDFIEIVDNNKHSNKHKHDKDERDDEDDDVDNEEKSRPYKNHKHNKNKYKNNNDEHEDRNHKDDDGCDKSNHNSHNNDKEKDRHNSHKYHHGKKPNGDSLDCNYNENNTNNYSYINKRESSDSEDTVHVGLETIKDFIEIVDDNKHNNNKHKHDKDDGDNDVDNDEKRRPYNNYKHNKINDKGDDGRVENNHICDNDDKEEDRHHNSHKHNHGKKPNRDSLDRNYNENNTNNSYINKRESSDDNKATEKANNINKSSFAKKSYEKRSTKPAKNYLHQNGRTRKRGKGNIGNKEENLEIFYKIIGKYKKTVKWS